VCSKPVDLLAHGLIMQTNVIRNFKESYQKTTTFVSYYVGMITKGVIDLSNRFQTVLLSYAAVH